MDGGGNDRAGSGGSAAGTGGRGGSGGSAGATGGSGGSAGGTSGSGGSAGSGGSNDGGGTDTPDASPDAAGTDGGTDGAAPTCSDGIKNSDETGVDCGGHCGKCAPGIPCQVNTDCQFSCKADKTCAACNVATDCTGVETECEHRTCTVGVCGTARDAAGTVLTVQNSGDCKRRQCAADGTVTAANDDTDVPEDRNPCTNDICTSGAPSHTMMPANSNCGGANHCNASGQCVGCAVAADCPGTDTACRTRTCTAGGVCGFNFTATNTKLVDPAGGDCKGLQCDGAGNSQVFNDNADLPVDGNACTTDECSSGTPSHRPVASGSACGGSLVCDGASHCVACLSATSCPGTDAECHTRSCVSGQCGVANTANGTLIAAQTPRDCKKTVCNGQGATAIVSDELDLPVDNNACTQDVCTTGVPSNPFVSAGNSCGANTICDGQGACVTCLTPSSCPGTDTDCHHRTCTNGACGVANTADGTPVPNQMAGDCKRTICMAGDPMVMNDDTDLPVDGNLCTGDLCTNGAPTNPSLSSGTACGPSLMCNGSGACVGCLTAADCGTNSTCQTHTCTNGMCGVNNAAAGTLLPGQTAGDCKHVECDGAGQSRTVNDNVDLPVDGNTCTQDLCSAGIPSNPPQSAGTTCNQSGGTRCNGSGTAPACVQCLVATDCSGGPDTECHTRTCSATGVCGVSNTPNGTPVSAQTAGDCKRNVCMSGNQVVANDNADLPVDGNGCTQDLCNAGAPSNPPVAQNAPCSENGGTRCNGSATAPACVQCLAPTDCSGSDTECQMRTCSATGLCGLNNVTNGTPLASQPAGDCKTAVCNGNGGTTNVVNANDFPVDGNACTFDICTNDVPSNPPRAANASCSQNNGSRCNGSPTAPACVQCLSDNDCGTDTACRTFSCGATGLCSASDQPDGTLVTNTPVGNCHRNVCMGGAVTNVVDDNDLPVDGNLCTNDVCAGGVESNPNVNTGVSCGPGNLVCNGLGACVGCLADTDCPMPINDCQVRVCMAGACGFTNVNAGTQVPGQTGGDCKHVECDGVGDVRTVNDDADVPVDGNVCTQDLCSGGTASNPPVASGATCSGPNNAVQCDGMGACVECVNATQCPGGPDTECHTRTCTLGACGITEPVAGTPVSGQASGDCQRNVCDGMGVIHGVADDTDAPTNNNECATTMCMGGAAMTSNLAHGTSCTVGGRTCDGAGVCITSFNVLRMNGTGTTGTAVTLEERKLDGTVVMTTNLPTTASGSNLPLVNSGGASSEGSLSLSADGRYLILAGYNSSVGTANVAAAAGINRVVGRVDAASPANINTTTQVTQAQAYLGNNIRGATSADGTSFWMSGAGGGTPNNGGVWWIPLAGSTPTQIMMAPASTNTRVVHIFNGQLYASAANGSFFSVFPIGTGTPTTSGQPAPLFPGLPTATASPFSFAFFDREAGVTGFDTLYIADDGNATVQGIQKWTLASDGANWMRTATFNLSPVVDFKGLAAFTSGSNVVLIGTTDEGTSSRIVTFTDTGSGSPTGSVIGTSTAGQIFRGVALSPHL